MNVYSLFKRGAAGVLVRGFVGAAEFGLMRSLVCGARGRVAVRCRISAARRRRRLFGFGRIYVALCRISRRLAARRLRCWEKNAKI